jgi:hypothetical protein
MGLRSWWLTLQSLICTTRLVALQWACHPAQRPLFLLPHFVHRKAQWPALSLTFPRLRHVLCLASPLLFFSHWPMPILDTVGPYAWTRVQMNMRRYYGEKGTLRWAQICFDSSCFRLSLRGNDNLKILTENSQEPKEISRTVQGCSN